MDFSKLRNYLFLGLLLGVTVLLFYLFRPFLYPMFWAAVIAGTFYPFYLGLNNRLRNDNVSAVVTLLVVTLILIIPLIIVGVLVFNEVAALIDNREVLSIWLTNLIDFVKSNSWFARFDINQAMIIERFNELSQKGIGLIFNSLKGLTQNSFLFAMQFILMLYSLFFFLRDGEKMLNKLMFLLPLGDKYEKILYQKFTSTTRAALKGTLVISLVQGGMTGILLSACGIPGSLILAILAMLASLIPSIGAALIWFPIGVIMLITGSLVKGIIILAVGMFVISTIDNFLRPYLVGKDLKMHPLIILFSTLGGIAVFGISGFVIGPIVASLFMTFWEMYEHYYYKELSKD